MFGKTRQGYYQREKYAYKEVVKDEILLSMVQKIRKSMSQIGGQKLHDMLAPTLKDELIIGRDSFFDLLRREGLLIRKRKNKPKTTDSRHWLRKYPNLIKDFVPTKAHQLWVSDITYLEIVGGGFVYLFLITDAYSRKIIGWSLSETLEADNAVDALKMAISQLPDETENLIHHSDRGSQYCSSKYVNELRKNNILISMTENGDPRENAIAERVNGILKTEWLNHKLLIDKEFASNEVSRVILIYNTIRPHSSINMLTPEQAHNLEGFIPKRWKNYRLEKFLLRKEKEETENTINNKL